MQMRATFGEPSYARMKDAATSSAQAVNPLTAARLDGRLVRFEVRSHHLSDPDRDDVCERRNRFSAYVLLCSTDREPQGRLSQDLGPDRAHSSASTSSERAENLSIRDPDRLRRENATSASVTFGERILTTSCRPTPARERDAPSDEGAR